VKDPCLNKGFERNAGTARKEIYEGPTDSNMSVTGAAEGSVCSAELAKVFSSSKCSSNDSSQKSNNKRKMSADADASSEASEAGTFTFNCVFQPSFVSESKNLLVFENFYYTSSALAVQPSTGKGNSSATEFPLLTTPLHIKAAADKHCGRCITPH